MRTIAIVTSVDVLGALAQDTLTGNVYLIDDNQANGSTDEGTGALKTMVEKDDVLLWTVMPIEPEAYASISDIVIDSEYCVPIEKTYEGSDVIYWEGVVKRDLENVPYSLKMMLGCRTEAMSTSDNPSLIGSGV